MITAVNGLKIIPETNFSNTPSLDILIVPGGCGTRNYEIKKKNVIEWIKEQRKNTEIIASVCTGAYLLAECGMLHGKQATTHRASPLCPPKLRN